MTVYCRQVVDDIDQTYAIAPHRDDQTDFDLLTAKFNGAKDKGWEVEWTDQMTFVAKKVRWQHGAVCVRTFWSE